MPTLQELQSIIKKLDGQEVFINKAEIKELPNILWHDEMPEQIVTGFYNNGNGILVATDRRLIFIDKGLVFGLKVEDFPYDKISSIQYETGILMGKITIFTSGNKAVIDNVIKNRTRAFGDWVRARISSPVQNKIETQTEVSSTNISTVDIADQLERLAKLKQQGFLTDEEFAHQKRKFLGM